MSGKTVISYATADRAFALKLVADLRDAGIDPWVDVLDIPKGARWDDEIELALRRCDRLLLILSPAAVASQNVKDEVAVALRRGITILPVVRQACEVPLRIERLQRIDMSADYEGGRRELIAALSGTAAAAATSQSTHERGHSAFTAPADTAAGDTAAQGRVLAGVRVRHSWIVWIPALALGMAVAAVATHFATNKGAPTAGPAGQASTATTHAAPDRRLLGTIIWISHNERGAEIASQMRERLEQMGAQVTLFGEKAKEETYVKWDRDFDYPTAERETAEQIQAAMAPFYKLRLRTLATTKSFSIYVAPRN